MTLWIVYYSGIPIEFNSLVGALNFAIDHNCDFDYFLAP
jgi:hypothetical protein